MSSTARVGLFVVATLALFGAGIFWIGSRDFRFGSTYQLNSDFSNVAGLDEGAAVRVGGMHQGTVRKIVLPQRSDQKIRVEMDVSASARNVIKNDSVAAIRTEGLVGDQYVEISFGSAKAPSMKNGDTIASEPPLEIADMIKKTSALLEGAQEAMQSIDETAGNMREITAKVNQGKGTAGALLNDRAMYDNMNQATRNIQEDTEALKHNFLLRGFFKKRGYDDPKELKQHSIAQVPQEPPDEQFAYPGKKLFDKPESAKMKNSKLLDPAGHFLESGEHGPVIVAASADQKGDSQKQREMTQARATVVRQYLVQHFKIDDKQVTTIGLGKSQDAPDGGEVAILIYSPATKLPPQR